MRRLTLALLASAGCNWAFGLEGTRPYDARPDSPDGPPDAPFLRMVFERQTASTDASGNPLPASGIAISPPPTLQLGAIGQPLQTTSYDPTSRTFVVPFGLPGNPWRLIYTTDHDPVPTEIQWTANNAHLVLPWLGRDGDPSPPAASGYRITPTPAHTFTSATRMVTSGAFTLTQVANVDRQGATLAFPYAIEAQPILGPLGTPSVARGDWQLVFEMSQQTAQTLAANGHAWMQADLSAGALTSVAPAWTTTTSPAIGVHWADTVNAPRFNMVAMLGGACCSYHLEYGILPSPYIPPFVPSPTGVDTTTLIDLYSSDSSTEALTITLDDPPATQIPLPRMVLAAYRAPRTIDGVDIATTIETLGPGATLDFAAPLAIAVMFAGTSLMTGNDTQPLTGSAGTMTLQWLPESGNINLSYDDFVVTLYELGTNTLTPLRHYQVLAPRVDVDGTLLVSGHHYVFGITARKGFPNAAQNDYTGVTLPFSETTTFPHAFVIQ